MRRWWTISLIAFTKTPLDCFEMRKLGWIYNHCWTFSSRREVRNIRGLLPTAALLDNAAQQQDVTSRKLVGGRPAIYGAVVGGLITGSKLHNIWRPAVMPADRKHLDDVSFRWLSLSLSLSLFLRSVSFEILPLPIILELKFLPLKFSPVEIFPHEVCKKKSLPQNILHHDLCGWCIDGERGSGRGPADGTLPQPKQSPSVGVSRRGRRSRGAGGHEPPASTPQPVASPRRPMRRQEAKEKVRSRARNQSNATSTPAARCRTRRRLKATSPARSSQVFRRFEHFNGIIIMMTSPFKEVMMMIFTSVWKY